MKIRGMTIEKIRRGIEERRFTSQEVVEETLKNIKTIEETIDGFLFICGDEALDQAKKIDEKIRRGETVGRLVGVPVAIKDSICTDGTPTTSGSRMLEDFIPPYDATVVAKLKEEDAIIIGKTNMDEFGMGSSTENSAFKITKNPWNTSKGAEGSSAVVAAGMATLSLGTDTGGTLPQASALCGLVGIKPTYGLVSRYGLIAFASSFDTIGPIATNVRDCAISLEILQGRDTMDATSHHGKIKKYLEEIDKGIVGYRIAIPNNLLQEDVETDVVRAFENCIDKLKNLGAIVEEISLPLGREELLAYYILSSAEASSNLGRYDGIRYGYRPTSFQGVEDLIEKSRTDAFGKEVKQRILLGTYALSSGHYDDYYKKAIRIRERLRGQYQKIFLKYDLIATPTTPYLDYSIGARFHNRIEALWGDRYAVGASLGKIPALSMPCGISQKGLPIGLQLVGGEFEEDKLFKAAYSLEQELKITYPLLWEEGEM